MRSRHPFIPIWLPLAGLTLSACGAAEPGLAVSQVRTPAALPSLGGDASCVPFEPTTPPTLCEWLGGFHAVVGGTIRSVKLVDSPVAKWSGVGANQQELVSDSNDCAGHLDLALRLEIDVTNVFYGEASIGTIEVSIGSSAVESMYPGPEGEAGESPWWDGAGETAPLATGSWVGLPLIYLADRGWSLAFEMPFTAGVQLDLARVEFCGLFSRPTDLYGMAFDDFTEQSAACTPTATASLERRLTYVASNSAEGYAAWCHKAVVIHECDVDADCMNATICQKNQCVVPGYGG